VQIVLAITFCCQSGKASHCFFAFFVLEEVVLYLTLGVAGLFKLSSGRPRAEQVIAENAEAAAADLGVGFGFVLLTLASLVHRVILVVKLERQRRIRALQDAERAIQRARGSRGSREGGSEVDPAEYQKPPPQYEPPPTYEEAIRIAREASASLRKEFRNAVSGSYSKIVSLSRVGSGNVDQLNRQSSGQAILDVEAIEREVMEERTRPSTEPGPRRNKFLSPIQASFLSLNEIARGARSAPVSGRNSPVPVPLQLPSRPGSAMSGIINMNFSEEKCHSPSPLVLSPQFLLPNISSSNNNVTNDCDNGIKTTQVAQVHVV